MLDDEEPKLPDQGWHYSPWIGIMYGKIPVGIILVTVGVLVYFLVVK